jgi:hypothetical protein
MSINVFLMKQEWIKIFLENKKHQKFIILYINILIIKENAKIKHGQESSRININNLIKNNGKSKMFWKLKTKCFF